MKTPFFRPYPIDEETLRLAGEQAVVSMRPLAPDGAQAAATLTRAILARSAQLIASGADPVEVKRGLDAATRIAVDVLGGVARPGHVAGRDAAVIPGAGFGFLRAVAALEQEEPHFFEDVRAGMLVLQMALEAPTRALAESCGVDQDDVVAVMRAGRGPWGLDVTTGTYVDLVDAGIVEPVRAAQLAVEVATTVAWRYLETPTRAPEKDARETVLSA